MAAPQPGLSGNLAPVTHEWTPVKLAAFKKAVHYIIHEWPSLDLAIENGMGGRDAREKRDWMCQTVVTTLCKAKDMDLEDFLAQMINQEFDTLIEDGSLEYNAKWIEKFYKDCLQGKDQEVVQSIEQAARKKQSLGNMRIPAPVCQTQESSDDDDDDDDDDGMDDDGDGHG